jgi:TolB-like protein/DNA-binding winged helix-turn-helix (wHTH) protein/tetratricopeptide (TPR) repeat protein
MDGPIHQNGVYVFGPFRLDPIGRALTKDGVRVHLAARLFDTLLFLVERHDRLVERDELLHGVWPARNVDETSLGRAISSLRQSLKASGASDSLIVTAPGRGYRFGAAVRFEPAAGGAALDTATLGPALRAAVEPAVQVPTPHRAGWWRAGYLRFAGGLAALAFGVTVAVHWRETTLSASAPPSGPLSGPSKLAAPPRSVAVLPFVALGGDARATVLSDSVSEDLINALGRVGDVHVAASTSSFLFKDGHTSIGDIARQLNVGMVLEGSVRRQDGRILLTADLIDATTGFQIWSRRYDRAESDMLASEGDIAEAVIASLNIVLPHDGAGKLTVGLTANPRAYDAFLVGMSNLAINSEPTDRKAASAFTDAIDADPGFAMAYAQRARAIAGIAVDGVSSDMTAVLENLRMARRDAEKAIALAPDLGAAHAALGFVLKCNLSDLAEADAEFSRAVALAPGDAATVMRYGFFQRDLGHVAEGVAALERAASLDPLTPSTYRMLAFMLAYAGRFGDAETALRRAAQLLPADPSADRIYRGRVEMLKGDPAAMYATCRGDRDYHDMLCLTWALHGLGRQQEAEAELAKLKNILGDNGAYNYARIYVRWGEPGQALQWLQTAYRVRDPGLIELKADPVLAPLRRNAIFQDIEGKLGFPP